MENLWCTTDKANVFLLLQRKVFINHAVSNSSIDRLLCPIFASDGASFCDGIFAPVGCDVDNRQSIRLLGDKSSCELNRAKLEPLPMRKPWCEPAPWSGTGHWSFFSLSLIYKGRTTLHVSQG